MNTKQIEKEFLAGQTTLMKTLLAGFEAAKEAEVKAVTDQQQAKLDKLTEKVSAKLAKPVKVARIAGGKRGAPAGTQKCRIFTNVDSKGPRFSYLCQQVHDHFYTGRTKEEAKALVAEVLKARAANEVHPMDPGPGPDAATPVTATEATTESKAVEPVVTAPTAVPPTAVPQTDWAGDQPSL